MRPRTEFTSDEFAAVSALWAEYGAADREMASLASRRDDEGEALHTAARERVFRARAELEAVGAWR